MAELNTPPGETASIGERRSMVLVIGPLKLKGLTAAITLVALMAAIVLLLFRVAPLKTSWPMWLSGVLWLAFVGYWSVSASNSGAVKSRESVASRRVHQRLLNGALFLLFLPIPYLGTRFLPEWRFWTSIGLSVQSIFLLLAIWARRHLGQNWSAAITAKVDHHLIRTGPYRVLRHPIYTAMLGMFAGTAIVSGEMHALIGAVIVSAAYARKIGLEEQNLREIFGSGYDDYRRDSWALIPLVY